MPQRREIVPGMVVRLTPVWRHMWLTDYLDPREDELKDMWRPLPSRTLLILEVVPSSLGDRWVSVKVECDGDIGWTTVHPRDCHKK